MYSRTALDCVGSFAFFEGQMRVVTITFPDSADSEKTLLGIREVALDNNRRAPTTDPRSYSVVSAEEFAASAKKVHAPNFLPEHVTEKLASGEIKVGQPFGTHGPIRALLVARHKGNYRRQLVIKAGLGNFTVPRGARRAAAFWQRHAGLD